MITDEERAAILAANERYERSMRRESWLRGAGYVLAALAIAWFVWAAHHPGPEKLPAYGARCRDGSVSNADGQGACSYHGGVARWIVNGIEVCNSLDLANRYASAGRGVPVPPENANCTVAPAHMRGT